MRDRDRDLRTGHDREDAAYAVAASTLAVPLALVRRDLLAVRELLGPPRDPPREAVDAVMGPAAGELPAGANSAVIDFVVDAAGAAVPSTVLVTRFSHPVVGRVMADLAARQAFAPARVAGCGVPVLVRSIARLRTRVGRDWLWVPYYR